MYVVSKRSCTFASHRHRSEPSGKGNADEFGAWSTFTENAVCRTGTRRRTASCLTVQGARFGEFNSFCRGVKHLAVELRAAPYSLRDRFQTPLPLPCERPCPHRCQLPSGPSTSYHAPTRALPKVGVRFSERIGIDHHDIDDLTGKLPELSEDLCRIRPWPRFRTAADSM